MKKNKIYFASPWFTPEQEEREERLKAKLRSLGFVVHSPKEEAVCGAISDPKTRQKIFDGNIDAILKFCGTTQIYRCSACVQLPQITF